MCYFKETLSQNAMRRIFSSSMLLCLLMSCNQSELKALREENAALKEQASKFAEKAEIQLERATEMAAKARIAENYALKEKESAEYERERAEKALIQLKKCQGN